MNELLLKGLRIHWEDIPQESWLRQIHAIAGTDALYFRSPVTLFAGENGSGKSTLLEAIAVAYGFNPEGGTRNYSFSTYDSHSDLHEHITLMRSSHKALWGYYLRAESFYNVATKEEEYSETLEEKYREHFHRQSHGESFLSVLQHNLHEESIYFFDEPEAALSPQMQLTLLLEIHHAAKAGAQFIIATHSPILLGIPDAQILNFDDGMRECSYEETGSLQIMKLFVNHRDQFLERLLEEEDL